MNSTSPTLRQLADRENTRRLSEIDTAAENLLALGIPFKEAVEGFRTAYLLRGVASCRGNVSEAARRLGIHRNSLLRALAPEREQHADSGCGEAL